MSRNGETVKNADEWALIFKEIGEKLECEMEKGREYIRSSAEKFKQVGRKKYAYVDATQHIPEGCGCCPTWEQTKRYPPKWE